MKPVRVAIRAGARRASRRQWLAPPVRRSFSQATALLNQQSEQREMTGDGSFATTALVQGLKNSKDPVVSAEIANFLRRNEHRHRTAELGVVMEPHYEPNDLISNPPSAADISIELLLASQTHMGHATSLWHPANSRYIFGIREGIHIISLDTTAAHLRRAATIVSGVAEKGGVILFVGTRKGHERSVIRAAELAESCHLFERWMPGSVTNGQQILGRCKQKVVDEFDREVPGFTEQLENRPSLKPDLVVCLNVVDNYIMLHECGLAGIPTIGIVDTDANPSWVTYPIPANDDSHRSIALISGVLGRAGQEGQARRRAVARRGEAQFARPVGLSALHETEKSDDDDMTHELPPNSDPYKQLETYVPGEEVPSDEDQDGHLFSDNLLENLENEGDDADADEGINS